MTDAARRIAEVVGAVARQALADYGRTRIVVLHNDGPEAELAARILRGAVGEDRVTIEAGQVESGWARDVSGDARQVTESVRRMWASQVDDALVAHPANKTALLLGGALPPDPLLPLGDLWATEVSALAGGWSAPAEVMALAEAAGGIEVLDTGLRRLIDGRDPAGLDVLPDAAAARVRQALAAGSASRRYPRIVPKLGVRTLCADLFE
jgi:hypothetical protein